MTNKRFAQLAVVACPVVVGLLGYNVPSLVGIIIAVLGASVGCLLIPGAFCQIVVTLLTIGGLALMVFSQGNTLLL